MPIDYTVSTLDAVPEAMRSLYVHKDGVFVLDVSGVVPESEVSGLKKKAEELLTEKKKQAAKIDELLESARLTDERRAQLEQEKAKLEEQYLSADELAANRVKQAKEEAMGEINKIKQQAEHFQGLYTTSTIEAALTRAAQDFGAYSGQQIHGLLAGQTVLDPVIGDDGKPTGQYRPMTTVSIMDGDKRVTKTMPADEAVKAYLSLPENRNLVNSKFGAGGGATGGNSAGPGVGIISASDTKAFGANLEAIAAGKVKVQA